MGRVGCLIPSRSLSHGRHRSRAPLTQPHRFLICGSNTTYKLLLRRETTAKGGIATKRKQAGWNDSYLLKVLSN